MTPAVHPVARVLNLVHLERKEIATIYLYAILSGLIQLSLPVGIQAIIGFVLGGAMVASLAILIGLVVLGVLFTGMLQIGQMEITEKIQQKIFLRYTYLFADRIPRLSLEKTDRYYLPELVNRYFEIPTLQKGLAKLLLEIPTALIQILFGLVLLSLYHSSFILFGLLLILILWLILHYSGIRGLRASLAESHYKYTTGAWLEEMARHVKTFKFSKGSAIGARKADEQATGYLKHRNEHFGVLKWQFRVLVAFKVIITAAMLIVGSLLLVNQQLNIGQFVAAEIVIITLIGSVEKLIGNLETVYDVLTAVDKLSAMTEAPVEEEGTRPLESPPGGLRLEAGRLRFAYPDQEPVLEEATFHISPGQWVCIRGEEGSGKSTLLRLMSGAYRAYEGTFTIDRLPPGNFESGSLRSRMGILLQQQDIFQGTLWENVTMGHADIRLEEITDLFHGLGLDDYLASLPKGLDTPLDPMGNRLPRSVVLKLLLVRALAGRPALLLLEDPWLGMHASYRRQVIRLLRAKYPRTTVVIATQDLEFAGEADQVLEIHQRKIKALTWKKN
ncbi:MAG TPA: ABC transporter ATP-binding protein [Chitinophagaceae bacterium]|nr:ABC transporter ATP-binding protein [Chitinophagaceae bacterium]